MKKILLIVAMNLIVLSLVAQVAINTTGNSPDASAMLDIQASNKGLLIPRVALTGTSDNTTIPSPATGLLVYNTNLTSDVNPGFYYYDGTVWKEIGRGAYHFENGLYEDASGNVRLGGYLSENTNINFGFNNWTLNLNGTGQFYIQSNGTDKVVFENDGDVNFKDDISVNEYINFEGVFGSTGYGFRTRSGILEYKKSGGQWSPFPEAVPSGSTPIWWYRPEDSTFIRPQNNDNIRIYDDNEKYGFYYDGATNQYGGFFRTQSAADTTSAVVGFSDIAGLQTYGYLGYSGNYTNPYGDLTLDGAAVYGKVDDKKRAAIFGRTTRDATVASIIGFSDVWIAGYYYSRDIDERSSAHPALYGQLLVDVDKSGEQAAIETWSAYIAGTGNRGYIIGGNFDVVGMGYNITSGQGEDAIGVDIYAQSYGTNTYAFGSYIEVDSADNAYGLYVLSGTDGVSSTAYGIYSKARTSDGTGIIGIGSNASKLFSSGYGDGVIGVSDNGYGVLGYFDDGSENMYNYGVLGYSDDVANFLYHYEQKDNGLGQSAVLVERKSDGNDGSSYDYDKANFGLQGINLSADLYSFGIAGYSVNDNIRVGGTFGGLIDVYNSNQTTKWGVLGYACSNGSDYGAYYTSLAPSAKNKNSIGFGSYSDFVGGWIYGDDYGLLVSSKKTSLLIDGQAFTNSTFANISEKNKTVSYYTTTENPSFILSGVAQLSSGRAIINFDKKYQNIIDANQPIIVTVTPVEQCKGLYVTKADNKGFVVEELNGGKSNIKFNWIAIVQRTDIQKFDFDEINDDFSKVKKLIINENENRQFNITKSKVNATLNTTKKSYKKEVLQGKKQKYQTRKQTITK